MDHPLRAAHAPSRGQGQRPGKAGSAALAGLQLINHPRVWLTPHTCAISPQVQQTLVDKLLRSLDRLAAGQTPESLIQPDRGC